jgi:hypothetical protein
MSELIAGIRLAWICWRPRPSKLPHAEIDGVVLQLGLPMWKEWDREMVDRPSMFGCMTVVLCVAAMYRRAM